MSSIRAFFAIDLPEKVKTEIQIIQKTLEKQLKTNTIRWTQIHNLHVTLQFLPDVKENDLITLINNVKAELNTAGTFSVELGTLELFPTAHHPHLIAMQIGPYDDLAEISNRIGQGIINTHYPI